MDIFKAQPRPTHAVPTEDFSLNYEEVKVTYAETGRDKWIPILSWP